MAKHGKTKKKILTLIKSGNNNLSTISKELDLAPSTVSKHLQDLEENGLIVQKDDSHIKKWKYYEIRKQADNQGQTSGGQGFAIGRSVILTAVVLLVVAFAGFAYLYGSSITAAKQSSTYVPISITDPPHVPLGTQALYINYSSLRVRISEQDGNLVSVPINTSGKLDLMGLVNESEVIGGLSLGSGSKIEEIEFNIDSASIMIGNVSYPVTVQSNQVVATLNYNGKLNSSSGILLDFSPTVILLPGGNTTSFVMLPSLSAAIINSLWQGQNDSHVYFTGPKPLPQDYRIIFDQPSVNATAYNISLTGSGQNVSLGFSLKNKEADSIRVMGVIISPRETERAKARTIMVVRTGQDSIPDYQSGQNAGIAISVGENNGPGLYTQRNSSVIINSSAVYTMWHDSGNDSIYIHLPNQTNVIYLNNLSSVFHPAMPIQVMAFAAGTLNLMAESNGTLSMRPDFRVTQLGYDLSPQSSVYFHYDGQILWPQREGMLLNGTNYTISIITDRGIITSNFTR